MRIILIFLIIICCTTSITNQFTSYYGWIDEGEGEFMAIHLKVDKNATVIFDTLNVVKSLIHSIEIPEPDNVTGWMKVFKSVIPLKMWITSSSLTDSSITFSTEKYFVGKTGWEQLSFKGKIKEKTIEGIIHSKWCPFAYKDEVYEGDYELKFIQE